MNAKKLEEEIKEELLRKECELVYSKIRSLNYFLGGFHDYVLFKRMQGQLLENDAVEFMDTDFTTKFIIIPDSSVDTILSRDIENYRNLLKNGLTGLIHYQWHAGAYRYVGTPVKIVKGNGSYR